MTEIEKREEEYLIAVEDYVAVLNAYNEARERLKESKKRLRIAANKRVRIIRHEGEIVFIDDVPW